MTTQNPTGGESSSTDYNHTSIAYSHILSTKYFLLWRVCLLIYFFTLWVLIQLMNSWLTWNYFTFWTLVVSMIYHSLAFYATYLHFKHDQQHNQKVQTTADPKLYSECIKYSKYASFMQMISAATTVTVVIVFWGVLIPPCNCWALFYNDAMMVQTHGVTMILTIIDLYLCCNTISFKQTWWKLLIYGVLYLIWTIGFVFIAGYPVYYVLNWKDDFIVA